jgi:uncharacterized protein
MPTLAVLAQILLIIGGLNWGLIGLFDFDLVKSIFGGTVGIQSGASRIVYILVGLSAAVCAFLLTTGPNTAVTRTLRDVPRS